MNKKEAAKAIGHIPSGLFIVATNDGGRKDGYLASWVQQVSFEPLLISIAINKGRPGYEAIMSGKTFTVNVVGEHEMGYLKYFWSGYDPSDSPFDKIDCSLSESGGVILKDAKSVLECRLKSTVNPGDHEIIIAEVTASYTLSEGAPIKVHTRTTGLDY
ncbi:flavin reductase family protein [Halobacteriovorax sp. JY17]|uniref:flavin reductase family protein n=1 Tax=Halobacteriovorax sp. JY17 TaxID=2014617 RepID=UPI000C3C7F92|nr:flavin reductase family protein [Halobacteriovorax sp. JY17]PIK14967.1 MAG: hypothetical protein CES88_11580 [Halobacteriovorax sp. JY17]